MQVDLRVRAVLSRHTGMVEEELVVFMDVHDPDGSEDVGWIVVELPEYGLGWELEGEDLVYLDRGEEHWYGAAGLTAPGMVRVPRGALVRLTVGDLGGRTAEREIRIPLSTMNPAPEDFPGIGEGGVLIRAGGATRHFLQQGTQLYLIESSQAANALFLEESVREKLGGEPFFLVAESDDYLWLESGPWESTDF